MPKPIDDNALGNLIKILNPYSNDMNQPGSVPAVASGAEAAGSDPDAEFHVEIDDHIANYSSADWSFRGRTQTIKRALRITYRYPLLNSDNKETGFYATEHLLIGYAGGNGGG
jgi:hypothetical protein